MKSKLLPLDDTKINNTTIQQRLTSLVHYATLAPSSHNTQCWKFLIDATNVTITVRPDLDRRCPIVDPDDHHVYATLGCAVENIVVAANADNLEANVDMSKLMEMEFELGVVGVRCRSQICSMPYQRATVY